MPSTETHTARTLAEAILNQYPGHRATGQAADLARLIIAEANAGTEVMPDVTVTAYASTVHRGLNVDIDAPEGTPVTVHINDGRVAREVAGYDADAPFDEILTRFGLAETDEVYEVFEGGHGTADWRDVVHGLPVGAKPVKVVTRIGDADDWALGALHTGAADEAWVVASGSEFRLYAVTD